MAEVVVLSATWCGPCHEMKKALGKAGVGHRAVDVDTERGLRLARELRVGAIPAVFIHHGGDYTRVTEPTVPRIRAALRRHSERDQLQRTR